MSPPTQYPSPAATADKQDQQETTLVQILSALANLATAGNQTSNNTTLTSILSALSPLSTGVKQDTGNTTLSTIATTLSTISTTLTNLLAKFTSSTATITTSAAIPVSPSSVQIIGANVNRKGLYIYNNSANSIYVAYGSANTGSIVTQIIPTFASFIVPATAVYTGPVYATRNAGSGSAVVTELT